MIHLELDEAEVTILRETIEAVLSDLRMEIADTDRQDYRDMLKGRKRALNKVLAALGVGSAGGAGGAEGAEGAGG
jgi:hypothetical protein